MSQTNHEHGHDAHGASHGTLKDYVTGFVLSVILTVIPFWVVMAGTFESRATTVGVVLVFAVAQVLVHMVYFLHMSPKSDGGWNFMAMIFTIITLVIAVVGSIWVMRNLESHMMPHAMPGEQPFVPPSVRDISRE